MRRSQDAELSEDERLARRLQAEEEKEAEAADRKPAARPSRHTRRATFDIPIQLRKPPPQSIGPDIEGPSQAAVQPRGGPRRSTSLMTGTMSPAPTPTATSTTPPMRVELFGQGPQDRMRRRCSDGGGGALAYARRLQEEAFQNLKQERMRNEQQQTETAASMHQSFPARQASRNEESELRIALRMSARDGLRTEDEDTDDSERGQRTVQPWEQYGGPANATSSGVGTTAVKAETDQAIADFLAATGTSFSDLSVDLVNDIVHSRDSSASTSLDGVSVPQRPSMAAVLPRLQQMVQSPPSERIVVPLCGPTQNQRTTRAQSRSPRPTSVSPMSTTTNNNSSSSMQQDIVQSPQDRLSASQSLHSSLHNSRTFPAAPPSRVVRHSQSFRSPHSSSAASLMEQAQALTREIPDVPNFTSPVESRPIRTPAADSTTPVAAAISPLEAGRSKKKTPWSKRNKKKRLSFMGFRRSHSFEDSEFASQIPGSIPLPPSIPAVSPDKIIGPRSNLTPPSSGRPISKIPRHQTVPTTITARPNASARSACAVCSRTTGTFLAALDQKFHPDCFRCRACNAVIDSGGQFKSQEDALGVKQPYHILCHAELFGMRCTVCRQPIPVTTDGTVSYVKHPFFEKEVICIGHAEERVRVCGGCRRFEPYDRPFTDVSDSNRCLCPACLHSVVVEEREALSLWDEVLTFFERDLSLIVPSTLRSLPVLLVGSSVLHQQARRSSHVHDGSKPLVCSGLCLTDEERHDRYFQLPDLRFVKASGRIQSGGNLSASLYDQEGRAQVGLFAVICLCGLPRDLTAAVLAREATHAWIKMHPKYNSATPLPIQVEEGCAQLVAKLFLETCLGNPVRKVDDHDGPSDIKLRQYLKFSIERDQSDFFGEGYRKAFEAYQNIGMDTLLSHVMDYRQFPHI